MHVLQRQEGVRKRELLQAGNVYDSPIHSSPTLQNRTLHPLERPPLRHESLQLGQVAQGDGESLEEARAVERVVAQVDLAQLREIYSDRQLSHTLSTTVEAEPPKQLSPSSMVSSESKSTLTARRLRPPVITNCALMKSFDSRLATPIFSVLSASSSILHTLLSAYSRSRTAGSARRRTRRSSARSGRDTQPRRTRPRTP